MKNCLLVFALTFALGTSALWCLHALGGGGGNPRPSPRANLAHGGQADCGSSPEKPLKLPNAASARAGAKEGWEYSGEIAANFVSARAQLDSWTQNQGWAPKNKITLDASLSPREILTFSRGSQELTMLIWKISTDETGFAYRRESATSNENYNEFK